MYLLFDIGGTKTRIAYSEDGETFGEPVKFETLHNFEESMNKIKEEADTLLAGRSVTAIAGSVASVIDRATGKVTTYSNLPEWDGLPLEDRLSKMFDGARVYFNNDGGIVGLGEAVAGAGRGHSIVAYLTVSTGVGGARIVDQRIDTSALGFEPGWHIIDIDKTLCESCRSGTAEDTVSGTATAKRFGKKAYEVEEPEVWEELSKWLAVVVNNVICFWSPDVVVLGGSMIVGDPAIPVDRTEVHVREILKVFPKISAIKAAELGDFGGLHGALAYVKQREASV